MLVQIPNKINVRDTEKVAAVCRRSITVSGEILTKPGCVGVQYA